MPGMSRRTLVEPALAILLAAGGQADPTSVSASGELDVVIAGDALLSRQRCLRRLGLGRELSHGGGKRTAEELGTSFLGEIPIDIRLRQGGDEGRPSVVHAPKSKTAIAFSEISSKLAAIISVNTYKNLQPEMAAGS